MPIKKNQLRCLTAFFVLLATVACASSDEQQAAVVSGAGAPDFALPDQDGRMVRLSGVLDTYDGAVIAFYPKDDSRY